MTARGGRARLAVLWLVLALVCQGLVVQTHTHFGVGSDWAAAGAMRATAAATDNNKDTPAAPVCPLCEEKALFGAYLPGGSAVIVAPPRAVYDYLAASLSPVAINPISHAWRSRAPPRSTT